MFTEFFKFFRRRPALRLVVQLSAGILLAEYAQPEPIVVVCGMAAFLLCIAALRFAGTEFHSLDLLLSLSVVMLGVLVQSFEREDFHSKKLIPVTENETVAFDGIIVEEPSVRGNRIQCMVDVQRLSRNGTIAAVERRVVVHGKPHTLALPPEFIPIGASVRGVGVLEDFPRPRNPGEFDYGRYLELNDVHGVLALKDSAALVLLGSSEMPGWRIVVQRFRKSLLTLVDRLHGESEAGFLRGVLLADRSNIPADLKQAFIDTGTIHVLAVSGLHVGVVALVFFGIFGLFRLPRRIVTLATIVGLLFYMVLVGAPPSVVRATLMAVVLLVGPLLERKIDVYQSLSVAALVLLLWDSNNLFNVGFQLSFIAVLAIVYFYPVFSSVIPRLSLRVRRIWLLEPALKVFFVSLAAQLGTLPFTAYYFDRVSIVSFLANIVVVPVAAFNVVLGFTALLVFPVSAWLAQSYAALNGSLVTLLLWFVKAAAGVPYAYLSAGNVEASFPFLYYIGLVGLVNLHSKKTIKFLLVAGLVVLNVLVYSSFMRSEERSLQATFIDVWQGDAILLEFPSGKNVLLDAGSRSEEFDSGERIVAPFLRFKGITKLDALIMSHPHSDHIGGVPYLIDHVALGRLIEPRIEGKSATYQEVHLMAAERSVSVSRYGAGDTLQIDSETRLYVLYPDSLDDRPKNLNNASLVVKLVYGSSELLLVGDVEKDVEEKLISRYARYLSSAVLKVGHHGSSTSSTPEFLEAVQPSVAVISVGRNNKFRHPSPQVVELFRRRGIDLHRTDREGAIVLRSDGKKFNVFDWRQE